jgi:hypothetical protein
MSTKRQIINSDGTGPKLNGTQLFFRTRTVYVVDNNGKVTDSNIVVYYTAKGGGRSNTGEIWKPGDIDGEGFERGGYTPAAVSDDKGKTFTPRYYNQSDVDAGTIPFGKNVGDPVLSPQAMASLNAPNGILNQAINNSVINTAVKTKSGLAPQLSAKLKNTPPDPSKTPDGTQPPAGGASDPAKPLTISTSIEAKTTQNAGSYNPSGLQAWIYPTGLGNNDQDYIEFQMIEYGGLTEIGKRNFGTNNDGTTKILGRVYLPIQPTISDINTVDWQNDTINPLQAMGAEASLSVIRNSDVKGAMDSIFRSLTDASVKEYLSLWAAGKAVGTNIFSRFSGAVVNPNLELLFNGPQLRPFNFNFKLSPRSDPEAKTVKGIIRFFKQGMAVRKTEQELFLKAPNVFKIIYRNGKNKEHTSINKIKICALSQCSVDYTPDGSYATFSDEESTMTQYGLTLQFNELEPIFNEDYVDSQSVIGY